MEDTIKDPRFSHIARDPRFRKMKRNDRKVKIDERFKGMFKDKKFNVKCTVDKRGRPISTSTGENLRKYYDISSDDNSESDSECDSEVETNKYCSDTSDNMILLQNKNEPANEKATTRFEKDVRDQLESDAFIDEKPQKKNKSEPKHDKLLDRILSSSKKKELSSNSNTECKNYKSRINTVGNDSKVRIKTQLLAKEESESDTSDTDENEENCKSENATKVKAEDESESDISDDEEIEDGDEDDENSGEEAVDHARGIGVVDSSSSSSDDESTSEDDSDSDDDKESDIEHDWAELDKEAPKAEEITHRLALCNMDWDRLSAQDIMVLLNSFKPTGGIIKCVTIYPSEFGLQRMKEEQLKGPIELTEVREKMEKMKSKKQNETEEGSEFETEKLRQYQLRRLKYYYAVVECDSAQTANQIYTECDGVEYESSANRLDIRFIPNDMTFDQEPKSVASDVDIATYKPTTFVNTALQHSKVECTWDEDDHKRAQITRRKLTQAELETMDLEQYLASDSESNEEPDSTNAKDTSLEGENESVDEENGSDEEQSSINKYRKLLLGDIANDESENGEKKKRKRDRGKVGDDNLNEEPDMEMEISWEPGIKESTEKLVADKTANEELTPWEKYLKKKKEKKKKKREERKLEEKKKQGNDNDGDDLLSDDELPSDVDLDDPFFRDVLGDMKDNKPKSSKSKKDRKRVKEDDVEQETGEKQDEDALDLLMMDEDNQKQHFNLKSLILPEKESKTQRKKRLKREAEEKKKNAIATDSFKMNIDDTRFKAIYENPLFNIDPSAPEFKKTQYMDTLVAEKVQRSERKRKSKDIDRNNMENKKNKKDNVDDGLFKPKENGIDSLVKSVKSKTKMLEMKKKSKSKR